MSTLEATTLEALSQSVYQDQGAEDEADHGTSWLLVFLLWFLPFEWYRVSWLGNRSIVWLPLLVAAAAFLNKPRSNFRRLSDFLTAAPATHAMYGVYLAILTCAALLSVDLSVAVGELLRAVLQFAFYVIVGIVLLGRSHASVARSVAVAVPLSVVSFVLYAHYTFSMEGDNLLKQISASIASGEPNNLARGIIKHVVNYQMSTSSETTEGLEYSGSARNAISCAWVFLLLLSWVYRTAIPREERRLWHHGSLVFTTLTIPWLLLVLTSRSNLITLALAPLAAYALYSLSNRGLGNRSALVAGAAGLLILVGLGVLFLFRDEGNSLLTANTSRFEQLTDDARVEHYRAVHRQVLQRPMWGYGLGPVTPDGMMVHNLMLAAWFRAGVLGLAAAFGFYICLFGVWMRGCVLALRGAVSDLPFPSLAWAPTLLVGPLMRTLIAGQDGRFTRAEWFSVASFLVILAALQTTWTSNHDDA